MTTMNSAGAHKRQLGEGGPLGKCQHSTIALFELMKIGPVSAIGFGAMGLSAFYGAARTDDESREVVKLVSIAPGFIFAPADPHRDKNRRSNSDRPSLTRPM